MAPEMPSSSSFVICLPLGSAGEDECEMDVDDGVEDTADSGGVVDSLSDSICETACRRDECFAGVKSRLAILTDGRRGDHCQLGLMGSWA